VHNLVYDFIATGYRAGLMAELDSSLKIPLFYLQRASDNFLWWSYTPSQQRHTVILYL